MKIVPPVNKAGSSGEKAWSSGFSLKDSADADFDAGRLKPELHPVLSALHITLKNVLKETSLATGDRRKSRNSPTMAVLAALLLFSMSCSKDPEAVRTAALDEAFNSLNRCVAAASGQNNQGTEIPTIAIVSVANTARETEVRLVAYAGSAPAEFYLPVYKLSAGRWLINEKDRAYLLDEKCREYKLRDKKPPQGQKFPQDGIVRLNPWQAFEVTLSFYRLPDKTRMGMLIYAGKSLAFTVIQAPAAEVESR